MRSQAETFSESPECGRFGPGAILDAVMSCTKAGAYRLFTLQANPRAPES